MNKILSYFLLCIYATIMIKPIMPTIVDVFAHVFNYSEHMATVHFENGKYHVHYDYIAAAKNRTQEDSTTNSLVKKVFLTYEHTILSTLTPLFFEENSSSFQFHFTPQLLNILFQQDLRPPITIVV